MTLGKRLKKARDSKGHSMRQAAEAMGVSEGSIRFWERDASEPEKEQIDGIARYCGVRRWVVLNDLGYLPKDEAKALAKSVGSTLTGDTLPSLARAS